MLKRISLFFMISLSHTLACDFLITNISPVTFTYSQSTQNLGGIIQIKRTSTSNSCRKFTITATRGNSPDYNRYMVNQGDSYTYNVFQNSNRTRTLKDFPEAKNNETIREQFSNNSSQVYMNVYFYPQRFAPPYNTIKRGGHYLDVVTFKVHKRDSATVDDSRNLSINMYLPKEVYLSLVDTGAGFNPNDTSQTLDFGILEQGEQRGFDLIAVSNAGYSISFSSMNNGKLVRLGNNSQTIAYTVKVNGITKGLTSSASSPVEVASGSGLTTTSGAVNHVDIEIGSVSGKQAGNYRDYITVTATTTE